MSKQTTAISIKNRVFKINTLQVEAIAIKHFNTSFIEASNQIIEDEIFLHLLPKNLQKESKNLVYLQG